MTLTFQCSCGKSLQAPPEMAGRPARCPECAKTLIVPGAPAAPPVPVIEADVPPEPANQGPVSGHCAICQSPILAEDAQRSCPACQAPYHDDCWQENKGCAVYGCDQVPPTEHRETREIPVSYWGRESKPCPACNREILAAALRCRHCGATFASARPEDTDKFVERQQRSQRLPELRRSVVWLFVVSMIPCLAPFAALFGAVWYPVHRADLRALSSFYSGLGLLALIVSWGQTFLIVTMVFLFSAFRAP